MKKLTKVGLTALCGSLAAIASANAGEMSVSGGATASWSSNSKDVTGNPIGLNSGMTFVGSGELDNGTTFTLTLTHADQDAYSVGSMALTMPSMGSISIAQNTGGNGIGGYDDKMPTAWEETWGTSLGTSIDLAKGVGSSMNIQYKTPSIAGTTLAFAYSPKNDGKQNNDKGVSAAGGSSTLGRGYDIMLDSTIAGQNFFAGYSTTERPGANKSGDNADPNDDREEAVGGIILNIGPVKVGAQATAEWLGENQVHNTAAGYRNVAYGAAFNVNDNLSVSYGYMESDRGYVSLDTANAGRHQIMEITSYQVAYTMGGVSIKYAETSVENAAYTSGTSADKDGRTIALSFAF